MIGLSDLIDEDSCTDHCCADSSSAKWTNLLDRGGLCKVTEEAYIFFFEVEMVTRRYLCTDNVDIMDCKFKEKVLRAVEADEDVTYVWSKVTTEIGKVESNYLFQHIVNLYFTIRGNSFAKSVMEKYV